MPESISAPVPASPRTLWQRRVRDPIVAQLTQGISPEEIALTLAVGTAFALFPIIGTTTLLCFLAAVVLRLNQPIIQLLNQALWPVHVPVIILCVNLGERIFGMPHERFFIREMHRMFQDNPAEFFQKFGTTAWHAIVAWTILAPFSIAVIYYVSLPIIRSVVRLKAEAQAKALTDRPPEHPVP